MKNYIADFWNWSGVSPIEYSEHGMQTGKKAFEDEYPYFDEMIDYAKTLITNSSITLLEIDDILTIMALDNENEEILDCMVNHCSSDQLEMVIKSGVSHMQPHARWQIGELIYRRKPNNYRLYFNQLINDTSSYVRKRALSLLRRDSEV